MAYGIIGRSIPGGAASSLTTTFANLNVGGGGFTSGIQASPDGLTIVSRVDVFGCYIWNSSLSKWDLLVTSDRLPNTVDRFAVLGGIEIVVAPSNSSVIYMWLGDGKLYRSLNRGASFVELTNFGTHDKNASNGGDADGMIGFAGRLDGFKMAVDPINPDVLYVGTAAGVLVTNNGSQGTGSTPTFTTASGITSPNFGGSGYNFAFDGSSGATGGKTNVLYVSSEGKGIFKMTAPGGSFSAVAAGGPTRTTHMEVSPNGVLWVADDNNAYKLVSTTWTTYDATTLGFIGQQPHSVTVDPNHSASSTTEHVIFGGLGGALAVTTNSGTTWNNYSFTRAATDVPWLANTNETYMTNGHIIYNKATDTLWFAQGIGVWTAPGNTAANFVWTSATKGIESLNPQGVVATPNATSQPLVYAWDRPVLSIASIGTYPSQNGPTYLSSIIGGWGLDWASSDGSTLALLATWPSLPNPAAGNTGFYAIGFDASSTSTDNGATWTPTPTSTTSYSTNLTSSASAAAGTRVLTFGSTIPAWIGAGSRVTNTTRTNSVNAYVAGVTGTTITLDRDIASSGVSSGDTIKVGFVGSGQVQGYQTNAATTSGSTLSFASLPANMVHPGMQVYNLSNTASIPYGTVVRSVSGGSVTLNANVSSTVASGDVIQFNDATYGGALAASTPNNFVITPSDNSPFPYYTTDGGATWNPVIISGVPRALAGSTTSGSATVTVSDTSNLAIGAVVADPAGTIPGGSTVVSITNSTQFVMSAGATGTSANNVIVPSAGWSGAHYLNIKNAAADRVSANKFYLYNFVTGLVYVTSDSGATWSIANAVAATFTGTINGTTLTVSGVTGTIAVGQVIADTPGSPRIVSGSGTTWTLSGSTPSVGPVTMHSRVSILASYTINGGQGSTLKSVPGNAGHLFLTGANIQFQNTPLIRSTDGGATWAAVTGAQGAVTGVNGFGFGKAKPGGGGYPAVYIYGQVGGVTSLWRSDDNCATWVDLGTPTPVGNLGPPGDMDGDKNVYGQFYGAYGGWFYGTYN